MKNVLFVLILLISCAKKTTIQDQTPVNTITPEKIVIVNNNNAMKKTHCYWLKTRADGSYWNCLYRSRIEGRQL